MINALTPAPMTQDTLNRRARVALLDVRAQYTILRELEGRINMEPSLWPILRAARTRLAVLEARHAEAAREAVAAWNEKKFS